MFFMLVNITPKNQWNGKLGEGNYFRQQRKYTHTPDIHTHTHTHRACEGAGVQGQLQGWQLWLNT